MNDFPSLFSFFFGFFEFLQYTVTGDCAGDVAPRGKPLLYTNSISGASAPDSVLALIAYKVNITKFFYAHVPDQLGGLDALLTDHSERRRMAKPRQARASMTKFDSSEARSGWAQVRKHKKFREAGG